MRIHPRDDSAANQCRTVILRALAILIILTMHHNTAHAQTAGIGDEDRIIRKVRSGMRAGLVAGDRREYRALFAPHAVYVASRSAVPDQYSQTIDAQKLFSYQDRMPRTQPPLLSFDVYDAVTIVMTQPH